MTSVPSEYHYLFKVVLVGNSAVGKSSVVVRYADDEFSDVFLATIGVDFRFKSFPLDTNKIKLQIWDTAGHQRFRTITSSYYRGANAIMIVFDITDRSSFDDAIGYWLQEVKKECPAGTQVLLVGNKCDLSQNRQVTQEDVNKSLENYPNLSYIETSAKTADKVEEAFHRVASMLVAQEVKNNENKAQKKQKRSGSTSRGPQEEMGETSQGTKLNSKNISSEDQGYRQYCCSG